MTDHDDTAGDESSSTGSLPRLFAERYRLTARRGTGIDVAIFEALDLRTERTVAVKIVHPDIAAGQTMVDGFMSTMSAAAGVRHPNLAEVLDFGTAQWGGREVFFVVGENLTGGSLRELRDRGRELSLSQAVMIGLDVCRGLDVVHRAGLVHGDIRPSNLVFGDDGRLRIVDLGLASLVSSELWDTDDGIGPERAKYASPEQAAGQPAGQKSDVYALCLCLIESVTGQVPFAGESTIATLTNRIDKLMPVSADLGTVASVLERAGRPDPADRCTVAEFGRALVLAAEKLPRPAPIALVSAGLFAEAAPVAQVTEAVAETSEPAETEPAEIESAEIEPAEIEPAEIELAEIESAEAIEPIEGEPATDVESEPTADDVDGEPPTPEWFASPTSSAGPTLPPPVGQTVSLPPPLTAAADDEQTTLEPPSPVPTTSPVDEQATERHQPADTDDTGETDQTGETPVGAGRSRRTLLIALAAVAAVAVIGAGLYLLVGRTDSHTVPAVAGLDKGEALNMVSQFGWTIAEVAEPSDTVPAGSVIRTDPPVGAQLDEGGTLTFVMSTGPALIALPDVAGSTVDAAAAQLAAQGLVLQLGEQPFDETVAVGVVISWQVPDQPGLVAGDTVVPGTSVLVTVSAGPAPRVVPDLTGRTAADAATELQQLALVIAQGPDEFSSTVPAGGVARQDPAAGASVARDSTVTIVISKGPDLVATPALANLDLQGITAALSSAGLKIGQVKGDPAGLAVLAEVDGASLVAGQMLPRGTAIDVTFAVPAPATTVAAP